MQRYRVLAAIPALDVVKERRSSFRVRAGPVPTSERALERLFAVVAVEVTCTLPTQLRIRQINRDAYARGERSPDMASVFVEFFNVIP